MSWLYIICAALFAVVLILLIKIVLMQKSADELRTGMSEKLKTDTNTLLSVSSGDKHIKRLAADLNTQLRELRDERRRFQNGDLELKTAVTNISHDLRTPLTAICGYLELLSDEEKSDTVARYLSVIENRTQALSSLTDELFKYSVITSAPGDIVLQDTPINGVLEESISAYYAALKGCGIEPAVSIPEERIIRSVDKNALSRVFSNIISNAIKYSSGDLDITLTKDGEIIFTNTAPTLDKIQVGKLFDRFYTVETAKNSTGLGLSIAKALVEQMHGFIHAQYSDDKLSIHIKF